jgi:L-2-hydroxycarboxylate dehydrogenase (NAD+)
MGEDVTGTYHTSEPCTKGDLFIAIDPAAMGAHDFSERASAFLADLVTSETASNVEEIRLPGQRSVERDRSATTIRVDDDLWADVRGLAGGN